MRNPVRSERDAFHIAWGSAVVLGVSVALGALIAPLVGVALFVGAVAGALIWEIATTDPDRHHPLREAAAAGNNAHFGRRRVLVVANRTLVSEALRVTGRVGDPSVALGAIEDELRQAGADEVVIGTLPRGRSNWLETGIVE